MDGSLRTRAGKEKRIGLNEDRCIDEMVGINRSLLSAYFLSKIKSKIIG